MSTSYSWEGRGRCGSFRLRMNVWVCMKLWDPLRTRDVPERFWGDDSRRGAISKTTDRMFVKFHEMVGHYPLTNLLDFEWPWPKVKVTRDKKVKIVFFANNSVPKRPRELRQKLKSSLFSSLNISKYDCGAGLTGQKSVEIRGLRAQVTMKIVKNAI